MKFDFSAEVGMVLRDAKAEAQALRHEHVSPRHMLLALVSQWSELELQPPLADAAGLRRALIEAEGPGGERVPRSLPYTSRAKKSLEWAIADARKRGQGGLILPVNLLAGIMRADSSAAALLREYGAGAKARSETAARTPRPSERAAGVWYLEVDTASEIPIYEQIVQRIEEAVATGRLAAGERLPAVRELAAELELAPGTVARAYGALEERGVVITEGARGTRVAERTVTRGRDAERESTLEGLLKPVAVAAFHMGAKAQELRAALERAMKGILNGIA